MDRSNEDCSACGDALDEDEEEREYPRKDSGGDLICDDCYSQDYQFSCCWCEERCDKTDDQHNLLIVLDGEAVRIESPDDCLKQGIYQIVRTPYFASDYLDIWILGGAVAWLCDLPDDVDVVNNFYPCGHLCLECQNKNWERIGARPLCAANCGN